MCRQSLFRFIPACAGNRKTDQEYWTRIAVHPRVCGEQTANDPMVSHRTRFIPACAGNSHSESQELRRLSVHPRVCGEQRLVGKEGFTNGGSSPRVRGTGPTHANTTRRARFIPACAGNSLRQRNYRRLMPVHPRVCGEQRQTRVRTMPTAGSSPRVRGTAYAFDRRYLSNRFIPACAGNRFPDVRRVSEDAVHPRVCGEQRSAGRGEFTNGGSSPRVRGTGSYESSYRRGCRFIPACAGNRAKLNGAENKIPVHPRVCGEQHLAGVEASASSGSSPRVRGTAA